MSLSKSEKLVNKQLALEKEYFDKLNGLLSLSKSSGVSNSTLEVLKEIRITAVKIINLKKKIKQPFTSRHPERKKKEN